MANYSIGPAWSPDGKFIAIDDSEGSQPIESIYLVSISTGEKHRLTSPSTNSAGDYFPSSHPPDASWHSFGLLPDNIIGRKFLSGNSTGAPLCIWPPKWEPSTA